MYNKNSSRAAVTNRPCIQARYLIRSLSPLKCGLWCGGGVSAIIVINAPERKEVAQVILFFWGRVGRGYGLDVHDESMGLGICGGVVVIAGKGALCEVSVDRCTEG